MSSKEDYLQDLASRIKLARQLYEEYGNQECYPDELTTYQVESDNEFQVAIINLLNKSKVVIHANPEVKKYL